MTQNQKDTEEKILEAAKEVFIKKGMEGARMQEIADLAGINKALLHYYFRTKEKLFDTVFKLAFSYFVPKITDIMSSEKPLFEKIEVFVDSYISLLINHPYIPRFIINELSRNPDRVVEFIDKITGSSDYRNNLFSKLEIQIQKEIKEGKINFIEPKQLIINMIALCIFPFVAKPIVKGVFFDNNKKKYNEFLKQRKTEVANFIINSIKKK